MEGAEQLQNRLNGLYFCDDDGWEINIESTIFSFDGAKDIREYIAKVGKQQVKKELERYV